MEVKRLLFVNGMGKSINSENTSEIASIFSSIIKELILKKDKP